MNRNAESLIKMVLAIMFLVCLANMPYGYYQFARFAGMVGFALLAYVASVRKSHAEVIICIVLGILFQPFIKIALGRAIWNIVDVLVATGLIISIFARPRNGKLDV